MLRHQTFVARAGRPVAALRREDELPCFAARLQGPFRRRLGVLHDYDVEGGLLAALDSARCAVARMVENTRPGVDDARGVGDAGGGCAGEAVLDVDYEERGAGHGGW
jgi:hypothetical protein